MTSTLFIIMNYFFHSWFSWGLERFFNRSFLFFKHYEYYI